MFGISAAIALALRHNNLRGSLRYIALRTIYTACIFLSLEALTSPNQSGGCGVGSEVVQLYERALGLNTERVSELP